MVPNPIFAVFATGYNQVVRWVPVSLQDNSIVGLPLNLFVSWKRRNDSKVLVAAIED